MKVETRATEKVTKEEKVLTISESELMDILSESGKDVLNEDFKVVDDPAIRLLLTVSYAHICAIIHQKLFKEEE